MNTLDHLISQSSLKSTQALHGFQPQGISYPVDNFSHLSTCFSFSIDLSKFNAFLLSPCSNRKSIQNFPLIFLEPSTYNSSPPHAFQIDECAPEGFQEEEEEENNAMREDEKINSHDVSMSVDGTPPQGHT